MFERFTERVRQAVVLALAALMLTALLEITRLLQEVFAWEDGRSRRSYRRNRRPIRRLVRRVARTFEPFIKRLGPVTVTIVLPMIVASLQIVSEALKLLGGS
jgi:hypothetical protein